MSLNSTNGASVTETAIEATVLVLIAIVAIVGNVTLWLIVFQRKSMQTACTALILCLSVADILVAIINMPIIAVSIIRGGWPYSQATCVLLGFLAMLFFVTSVMSLASISIHRYLFVCKPSMARKVYTRRGTGLIIAGTWVFSALLASPPLYGWGRYNYLPGQSFCFAEWTTSISYTFFMVGMCFGGPSVTMTFCYIKILKEYKKSKAKFSNKGKHNLALTPDSLTSNGESSMNTSLSSPGPSKPGDNITPNNTPDKQAKRMSAAKRRKLSEKEEIARKEEVRLTATLLVVILVFVVLWLPFCVTMFISVFSSTPVPRIPDLITLFLGCFNSCCNPIIYGVMNTKFRAGYTKLFCCCRRDLDARESGRSSSASKSILPGFTDMKHEKQTSNSSGTE